MHGNVWEWCADWYAEWYLTGDAKAIAENPIGPRAGDRRVLRGGSWNDKAEMARSASRAGYRPRNRYFSNGFRIARNGG
jgi:formylglycine-generating enzyme required for sulfatase activity